jgi:hypothetical protein
MSALETLMVLLTPEQLEAISAEILDCAKRDGWGGLEITFRNHQLHSVVQKKERLFNHKIGVNNAERSS